jgi:hypothetical protein
MRTVADLWKSFEAGVLVPINTPPVQREEMRKAFYSGVKGGMKLMTEDIVDMTEDDGVAAIQKVLDELDEFVIDLFGKKGHA